MLNKKLIYLSVVLFVSTAALAQTDTVYIAKNRTVLLRIENNNPLESDISVHMTSKINALKPNPIKWVLYDTDTALNVMKFRAIKPFSEPVPFLLYSKVESRNILIMYKENVTKVEYSAHFTDTKENNRVGVVDTAAIWAMKKEEDKQDTVAVEDNRSVLEKNAKTFLNPKNKLFTAMRSKNQNISAGDIEKGVRVYLQKLYKSGNMTYFGFKIANFSMGDFQLSGFDIKKVDGTTEKPLTIINEETAYNFLKRFEKVDFIAIADEVELNSTAKLIFSFKSEDKGTAFKFELNTKAFQKREAL